MCSFLHKPYILLLHALARLGFRKKKRCQGPRTLIFLCLPLHPTDSPCNPKWAPLNDNLINGGSEHLFGESLGSLAWVQQTGCLVNLSFNIKGTVCKSNKSWQIMLHIGISFEFACLCATRLPSSTNPTVTSSKTCKALHGWCLAAGHAEFPPWNWHLILEVTLVARQRWQNKVQYPGTHATTKHRIYRQTNRWKYMYIIHIV